MAFTAEEGTQTCVVGTTHTLNATTPETTDAVVQVVFDTNALVADEYLEWQIAEKAISGGTQRVLINDVVAAGVPAFATPSLLLTNGWDVKITQRNGTGRAVPWSIRKVA